MLMSLDRDESQKNFSGSRKKILDEKFLDPKFGEICARTDVGMKCLRTRRDVFVLCRRLVSDYTSRPAHTSCVAVCLPDTFDLTATIFFPLR